MSEHGAPAGARLDPMSCITCSDALLEVRVVCVSEDGTWADGVCEGEACSISIELVAGVAPGDVLLTQGGVALQRAGERAL